MLSLLCAIGLHRFQHICGAVFSAFAAPRFVQGRLECTRCGQVYDDGGR